MTFCSSGDWHRGLLLTLLVIKERKKCHYLWWFVRQSRFLQSVLVSSPLIFGQSSYYFVISIVMTYSYIFTVTGGATAYQSLTFLSIHLSHLITVRVNNLLHPSCTVFMLWCCRLFAAWLVFQQFMTILQIVISLKHHTPSKTCEAFLLFIPKYNCVWEGMYAFTCWSKVKLTTDDVAMFTCGTVLWCKLPCVLIPMLNFKIWIDCRNESLPSFLVPPSEDEEAS